MDTKSQINVYWDMDGVLVDLEASMARLFPGHEFRSEHPDRIDEARFFKFLDEYTKLNGFRDAMPCQHLSILDSIATGLQLRGANCAILTSRGSFHDDPHVVTAQKIAWLTENSKTFSEMPFITTTSGRQKTMFAAPNAFLIDDWKNNIARFKMAGGDGYLYDSRKSIDIVCEELVDELHKFESQHKNSFVSHP